MRRERHETSNRVDDSTASIFKPEKAFLNQAAQRDTKEFQGGSGNNLREEPNFPLHGCGLEFSVTRHTHKLLTIRPMMDLLPVVKTTPVTSVFSLDDKGGVESEITGLHCIV